MKDERNQGMRVKPQTLAGITEYDHRAFRSMPEYIALYEAIVRFGEACFNANQPLTHQQFPEVVGEVVACCNYTDMCEHCFNCDIHSPYRVVMERADWIGCYYWCPEHGVHRCWYSIDILLQ